MSFFFLYSGGPLNAGAFMLTQHDALMFDPAQTFAIKKICFRTDEAQGQSLAVETLRL